MSAVIKYGTFNQWKYNAFDGGPSATGEAYPLPAVNWTLSTDRNSAGTLQSREIKVNIKGIVSLSGLMEHADSQTTSSFDYLIERAKFLQDEIFKNDNKYFEFFFANAALVSGTAAVENLEFSPNENNWTTTIDYSLDLRISPTGTGSLFYQGTAPTQFLSSCDDSFTITQEDRKDAGENYLYRLDRNISATAKAYTEMPSGALTYAKIWVHNRAEIATFSNIIDANYNLYNRTRNIELTETDGTYAIQDSFLLKEGNPWIYTDSVDISTNNANLRTITIAGEIEGLSPATGDYHTLSDASHASGQLDISGIAPNQTYQKGDTAIWTGEGEDGTPIMKYENAVRGYEALLGGNYFFNRALTYDEEAKAMIGSSRPLHGIPVSIDEGLSPQQGKITFSRVFDSRPTGLLKGTLFESFTYTDNAPKALIETVPVIGRRLGPLYYNTQGYSDVSTMKFAQSKGTRSITYEAFFPPNTGLANYKFPIEEVNKIDNYLHLYAPGGDYTGFITQDTQELNLTENKLTKTITWEYVECNA